MKISSACLYSLRIPFRNPFTHSLKQRRCSDSIVLKLTSDCGAVGFGEGIPREYVTGESVSSCLEHIQHCLLPALRGRDFPETGTQSLELLKEIDEAIPDMKIEGVIAANSARCAVELALLDCLLKRSGNSLGHILKPLSDSVTYSAVISAESLESCKKTAKYCRDNGMMAIKIKVGFSDDYDRVSAAREIMGGDASLRVDANGAFDVKGALGLIDRIQSLRIDSIEQPIPRGSVKELASVKRGSSIPVMVDESLIMREDALELIENDACDLFNLRISKNGGILSVLMLVDIARQAGIGMQLGCQVGEAAILSAAGRHLAAHLPDLRFIEGSYGSLLLVEDLAQEPVDFGYAGKAPLLCGNGLGVEVREEILEKYAEKIIPIRMD